MQASVLLDKPKIFVTRQLQTEVLASLREQAEVTVWQEELPPPQEVLLAEAREASGLLTLLTDRVDSQLMAAAPHLRVVSAMAVGYDNVDVAAATRLGILVTHTPGVLTETTADFAFALLLAATRRLAEADRFTRQGLWRTWHPLAFLGHDVHDATLGIVGLGAIGLAVARRARGFAMNLLYSSRSRKPRAEQRYRLRYCELDQLLQAADFVSLHVPLTAETYHLIGERELGLMKPSAILINTARGPVVDQAALYRALREKRIAGAALDVTEPEPIAPGDPLLTLDNVVITPHIASASQATRRRMATLAVENLLSALEGKRPRYLVNPEGWPAAKGRWPGA